MIVLILLYTEENYLKQEMSLHFYQNTWFENWSTFLGKFCVAQSENGLSSFERQEPLRMEGEVFAVNPVKILAETLAGGFFITAIIFVSSKRTGVLQRFMKCNDNVLNNEYHSLPNFSQSIR